MKVFLMHKDQDFDHTRTPPWNTADLTQDLALETLFLAMAADDRLMFDVARSAILLGLQNDAATVVYRQDVLRDSLENPAIVREIYDIAVTAIESERRNIWGGFSRYPKANLSRAIASLQEFAAKLKDLRSVAYRDADKFHSEGFQILFAMLRRELSDDYFAKIESHLMYLKFRKGILVSATLGKGNKGKNYVLRKPLIPEPGWIKRLFVRQPPSFRYQLHPRDEAGAHALSELEDRGINLVANALAQSTDHIRSFFNVLRTELAFYLGCVNLHNQLVQREQPTVFPNLGTGDTHLFSTRELYDPCLVLSMQGKVVGNDVNADHKSLVIVTGANQGGKSTFLRSVGIAQLMTQAGMFAPAASYTSELCDGLFTHYKREEDDTMTSGKFDEELNRMSDIADHITSNSIILFNESFAATNEREGSEIARQIVTALLERNVRVFFVSHLYDFAHSIMNAIDARFLRADREENGDRTFKLVEGEPLETGFGEDLYKKIFLDDKVMSHMAD